MRRAGLIRLLVPAALVGLCGVTFANALGNPFQYDDGAYIVENAWVRRWPEPLRYFRPPCLDSAGGWHAFYRPVAMLSFYGSFRMGGDDVRGFRLLDLVLHAAVAILTWVLARWLLRRLAADDRFPAVAVEPAAALAGAITAVHPLCTQTINEISKRDTLLAVAFMLGAARAYLAALQRIDGGDRRGWIGRAALGAALHAVALGSKEIAVSLPLLVGVADWLVLRPRGVSRRRAVVYALCLALPLALLGWFAAWSLTGNFPRETPDGPLPPSWRYALAQPGVILRYYRLLVSPTPLSVYHEVSPLAQIVSLGTLVPAAALAALVAAAVALRRRAPEVTLLVIVGLGHLAPTSLVANRIAMDEDRVYLLVALYATAFAALLGRTAVRLARRWPKRAGTATVAAAMAIVAALALLSSARNAEWSSRTRLWQAALEVYPTSRTVLLYLGAALGQEGRSAERLAVLREAGRLYPRDLRIRVFYAHALASLGRPEASHLVAQLAEEAPANPEVLTVLGHLHRARGEYREAAAAYRGALRVEPGADGPRVYLADCLVRLGRRDEAGRVVAAVSPYRRLSRDEAAVLASVRRATAR
jgi:Flp pilus assembly protein TadD